MKVPKIIHQIWYQGIQNLPEKYKHKKESWIKNNPEYTFIYWDEKSMKRHIYKNHPQWYKKWNEFKYMHQKIDSFKYIILYDVGGVYADMDTESLKPIKHLIDSDSSVIISYMPSNIVENYFLIRNYEMMNNGIIMSAPHHPFFKDLIHYAFETKTNNGSTTVSNGSTVVSNGSTTVDCRDKIDCIQKTTGPRVFTEFAQKYKNTGGFKIIDSKYLEACYSKDKWCKTPKDSFVYHDHAQTWIEESNARNKFMDVYFFCKHHIIYILIILLIIIYVAKIAK